MLALITPHLDDGPIFAFGTIAKLLREGYTGYLIRTSNDEKDSYDLSVGETVLANERDARALVKATGLKKVSIWATATIAWTTSAASNCAPA